LADAGWETLLLEAQPEVGGAVRSDRELHPHFVQDTFSAFYPMAAASPVIRGLHLERYGLRWAHAPAVLGHPRADNSWVMLHRDLEITASLLDAEHAGDGAAWRAIHDQWQIIGSTLIECLLTPFPPFRPGLKALTKLPRVGGLSFVRNMLTPASTLFGDAFGGDGAQLLLAGNALHADIPLDAAGSGFLGTLLIMLGQTVGFPVPEGGAGKLTEAMRDRFVDHGGQVETRAPVARIDVHSGKAVGVRVHDQSVRVRRAVLADVGAEQLYGRLLSADDLPSSALAKMRAFRRDPATLKIDYALSGPVPWAEQPPYAPGTVHIADSYEELTTFYGQLSAGAIPDKPFLLIGQMTTADPTRSPAGTESLWAYTHVPQEVRSDACGELTGSWDASEVERFADRMQARIEQHAPGFASRIIARRILGPAQLEARNANLVGGSVNGGTAALDQQVIFRPIPGLGRANTPIRGLYLASASAHPGGSVHGACGMNAARAALAAARFTPRPRIPLSQRPASPTLSP
ncbi:MAG TPA: NAD(P)/FAD-dependent oxidoreductase, partial [Propionibacteriaceae bacterium]|nr:NAD(P)/FAD-dependent oxidoreductase [Propionibacteriaceae bacterium]